MLWEWVAYTSAALNVVAFSLIWHLSRRSDRAIRKALKELQDMSDLFRK